MNRYRGLTNAPFEVLNRNHATGIFRTSKGTSAEDTSHVIELRKRVSLSSIVVSPQRFRQPSILLRIPDRCRRPTNQFGSLTNRECRFATIVRTRASRGITQLLKDRRCPIGQGRY
jgi:hypothetical protein